MPTITSQAARHALTDGTFSATSIRSTPTFKAVRLALKRGIDIVVAIALLLVAFFFFAVIAPLILIRDGRPFVYRHRRVGRDGKPFDCFKIRTMARDADRRLDDLLNSSPEARAEWASSQKLRDDPRVLGGLGRFLRQSSLDELPQLINVLRGDMSLVGPRPVVEAELAHYGAQARWYFATRPGLTGPWQVSGRSDTSYATRVEFDVNYARNLSLRGDTRILLLTPWAVFSRKGAC